MKELTRKALFDYMISNIEEIIPFNFKDIEINRVRAIYEINNIILNNIEEKFFKDFRFENNNKMEILKIISNNIAILKNDMPKWETLFYEKEVDKLEESLQGIINNAEKSKLKPRNIFNGVLKILIDWSDDNLNKYILSLREIAHRKRPNNYKKIFLSYAFEDHLYTLALFFYMYTNHLYLYVDWLQNDEIPDVHQLKKVLYDNLNDSEQLLFLQSSNMELNIAGNPSIKSWCAWELGNFYNISKNTYFPYKFNSFRGDVKFYISIYKNSSNKKHMILEGLKELTSVSHTGLS